MSIETDILLGLDEVIGQSSGSLVYLSGSTYVSCSVYKEYGRETTYETMETGYDKRYLNYSVLAKESDVGDWGLEPKKSKVILDGTDYLVGGVITHTRPFLWITLRYYDSSV